MPRPRLNSPFARARARAVPASSGGPIGDGNAATPDRLAVLVGAATPRETCTGPRWRALGVEDLPATPQRWAEITVLADSLAELRGVLPWLERAGRAEVVTLALAATDRVDGLRPPTVVGLRSVLSAHLTRSGAGPGQVSLRVQLGKPTRAISVARAALAGPAAFRPSPAAGLRLRVTHWEASWWAAGDPTAAELTTAEGADPAAFDVLVETGRDDAREPRSDAGPVRLRIDEAGLVPPVDTAVCSPRGFGPAGESVGRLHRATGAWRIEANDLVVVETDARTGLTENHIASLRALRGVRLEADNALDAGVGRLLAQLCCAGVPTGTRALPPALADALGAELTGRLTALRPETLADPIERESWSVGTRRLALHRFAARRSWSEFGRRHGLPTVPAPSVSVILATRREQFVAFALAQIARQDWPDLELVLVLHGLSPETPTIRAALDGFDRPVTALPIDAGVVFGAALNEGLRQAGGRLITKMDDDDWYGPHHITDLVQAHEHSGAALVGSSGYHVYLAGSDRTVRWTTRPTEAPATWLHGGTMLVAAEDLRSLGGWRAVPLGEDAHLLQMVRAGGGGIYGIHDLGFTYFRGSDHTWSPGEGDGRWLAGGSTRWDGFVPPPQVDPLPHPGLGPGT